MLGIEIYEEEKYSVYKLALIITDIPWPQYMLLYNVAKTSRLGSEEYHMILFLFWLY